MGKQGKLLLAGLIVLGHAASVHGQERLTVAEASRLFEQARPHLEAVLKTPVKPPAFRLASKDEIRRLGDHALEARLRFLTGDMSADEAARATEAAWDLWAYYRIVSVDVKKNVVFLVPDNAQRIAEFDCPRFIQTVLIYETILSSLDREYDLPQRWGYCQNIEQVKVLATLRAGRALNLTWKVTRRLGLPFFCPTQCKTDPPEASPRDTAEMRVCVDVIRGLLDEPRLGERVFGWGLDEKYVESRVFLNPPPNIGCDALLHGPPGAHVYLRLLQRDLFARLKQELPESDWTATEQPFTADMLRQIAAMFGQGARAEKIRPHWQEGGSLVWMARSNPGKQVALSMVHFDTPSAARTYFGFAVDLQRLRDQMQGPGCAAGMRVLESRSETVSWPRVDEATRCDKVMQMGEQKTAYSTLLARNGPLVVEFSWVGATVDAAWAERLFEQIVRGE